MSGDEEEVGLFDGALFEEPSDFRPPPPDYHFVKYERKPDVSSNNTQVSEISLRLVGKSPLWGHLLWNSGIYTANFIDKHFAEYIKDKKILEFGAASALPSILCLLNSSKKVLCTDYPDLDLLSNIQFNVDQVPVENNGVLDVKGFIWGNDTSEIKESFKAVDGTEFADFLIMSDLVFNHSEHHKLLKSCKELIKPLEGNVPRTGGKCLVVFSPHRPWLLEDDLKFFQDAKELFDFDVEHVETILWPQPMFPEEDKESEEVRRTVYSYILHPSW